MNEDRDFIKNYEKLLDKGYCDCNEMNCIDYDSPRRILNIAKDLQQRIDKTIDYIEYAEMPNCYYKLDKQELISILKGGNE